jgi:hypothetical protein
MRTWNDVAHLTLRRYDAWEGQSATMRAADEAMLKMYLAA